MKRGQRVATPAFPTKALMGVCLLGCLMVTTPLRAQTNGDTRWAGDANVARDTVYNKQSRLFKNYGFTDNWYLGPHVGTLINLGSNASHAAFFRRTRPQVGFSVGKFVNPSAGFRVQALLGSNRYVTPEYSYYWGSSSLVLDGLFNLTNLFSNFKESRRFNLIGLVGVGGEITFGFSERDWNQNDAYYNSSNRSYLTGRIGLEGRFTMSRVYDLTLEVTHHWVDRAYNGMKDEPHYNGHLNVLLGVIYRLKKHDQTRSFSYAQHNVVVHTRPQTEGIQQLVNEQPVAGEPQASAPPAVTVVQSKQLKYIISFEKNKADINPLQEVNVYSAYEAYRKQEWQALVYITPYGGFPDTSALFQSRAYQIKSVLMNEYRVPADRVVIETDPKQVDELITAQPKVVVYIHD